MRWAQQSGQFLVPQTSVEMEHESADRTSLPQVDDFQIPLFFAFRNEVLLDFR